MIRLFFALMLKEIVYSQEHTPAREPLAQKVSITIETTSIPHHLRVAETLDTPPTVIYNGREKELFERTVARNFFSEYTSWRLLDHLPFIKGVTRSLNAGQLVHTPNGEIIFIAKSPVNNPDEIEGLDMVAGASQQIGIVDLLHTAAREGTGEELVEIDRNNNIIVPSGFKEHTLESLKSNLQLNKSIRKEKFPEPFQSAFDYFIQEGMDCSIEKPYAIHPSLIEAFNKLPKAEVSIRQDDKTIHNSHGFFILHENGGDILYPRIVENVNRIIDIESYQRPDGSSTALNRRFILATPSEAIELWKGEECEITMIHLGKRERLKLHTMFKPLAHEIIRILAENNSK